MISVRHSSIHGRGVFADFPIAAASPFHVAHLLVFEPEQQAALEGTAAAHYVFHISDEPGDPPRTRTGLAMSPISFINHARPANTAFTVNPSAQTITFSALRDIAEGEELTIDYGDFAEKLGIA